MLAPIIVAAQKRDINEVKRLLVGEASLEDERRCAEYHELVDLLIQDRINPYLIGRVRSFGHHDIAYDLESYMGLSSSLETQITLLKFLARSISEQMTSHEIFDTENAKDSHLVRQTWRLDKKLKEKYSGDVREGMRTLRALVFKALLAHKIETSAPSEKIVFIQKNMEKLIIGDRAALINSFEKFNSNEDIYEVAARAVNPVISEDFNDDLAEKDDIRKAFQRYAGNIAKAIEGLKHNPHYTDKPYYENCVLGLIYRLSETRRAHNEDDPYGEDKPSGLAAADTRLLKALAAHPEYTIYTTGWRETLFEGAALHIEGIFRQTLFELREPKRAERLVDALLMFDLKNASAIKEGEPIMMSSGEKGVYTQEYLTERIAFVCCLQKSFRASVSDYLLSHGQEPIREEEGLYLSFLPRALGEPWIRQRLLKIYTQHCAKPEAASGPALLFSAQVAKLRQEGEQKFQKFQEQFYEYLETKYAETEYANFKVPDASLKAFFSKVDSVPKDRLEKQTLFEECLKQLRHEACLAEPGSGSTRSFNF